MKKISKNTTKEIECKSIKKISVIMLILIVVTILFLGAISIFSAFSSFSYAADSGTTPSNSEPGTLENSFSTLNISKTYAYSLMSEINSNITNIKSQGYKTDRFEDSLAEMKSAYDKSDYFGVYTKYIEVNSLLSKFYYLSNMLNQIDSFIQEMNRRELNNINLVAVSVIGNQKIESNQTVNHQTINNQANQKTNTINITQITFEFELGKNYFDNNNYEQAESALTTTYNTINSYLLNEAQEELNILRAISNELDGKNFSNSAVNNTINKLQLSMQNRDFGQLFLISTNIQKINESTKILEELKNNISFLENHNYKIARINDDLYEIQTLFEQEKYDELLTKYAETQKTISYIFTLSDKINQTSKDLAEKKLTGIDFSEAEYYFNLSIEEFNNENYAKSDEYLNKANGLASEIEAKNIFASMMSKARLKFDFLGFLKNNYLTIIIVLVLGYVFGLLIFYFISLKILQIQFKKLNKEQETITELIKKTQTDYFKTKIIDSDTYKANYDELENRFAENKRTIPVVKSRLNKKYELLKKIKAIFGR